MGSTRVGSTRCIGLDGFPLAPIRGLLHTMRRYDGTQKTSRSWDCLRRDPELWVEDGDCLIHLYGPGMSRRGPSFRIPFKIVEQSRSNYLIEACLQKSEPSSPTSPTSGNSDDSSSSSSSSSDSGYGASICSEFGSERRTEIYIRAPADLPRAQAFRYHVGTRNFFAFLLGKPLVGESLGKSLAELASRIESWQKDGSTSTEFLDYCQEQGYLDFSNTPDYAAASLYLADVVCIRDIWVDAFAHCVGMRHDVVNSPEAVALSNRTKALINRAALEMEMHLDRVTKALGVFLEEELGPEHLGLSKPLRNHLDRFRSWLHSHYVSQFGYFPPDESAIWNKKLWFIIFDDFRSLYEYLADTQSSDDRSSSRGVNGGVCVIQNVHAFDERHGFSPLPHPLPLLPEKPVQPGIASEMQKSLRSLRLARSISQPPPVNTSAREALACASNRSNPAVVSNKLVQEYNRFERAKLEERVSVSEARKVRWILVYSFLQMVISITRAPSEVQDTETPSYPLCFPTSVHPHWMDHTMATAQEIQQHAVELEAPLSSEMDNVRRTMETDRISIHPDCEAANAEDYFTLNNIPGGLSRSASDVSVSMIPSPLRTGPYPSRTASFRSGVNSLHRSVVGSLTRRNSARRASLAPATEPIKEVPFCEILVQGYGNGLEEELEDASLTSQNEEDLPVLHRVRTPLAELEGTWPRAVPTLELHQLHIPQHEHHYIENRIFEPPEEAESSTTSDLSSSYPSSTASPNKYSAFDFEFCQPEPPQTYQATTIPTTSHKRQMTAGTYIPTGTSRPTPPERTFSAESIASSFYGGGEEGTQAAEIEEEELRGRRRSRALDRVRGLRFEFGAVSGEVSLPGSP